MACEQIFEGLKILGREWGSTSNFVIFVEEEGSHANFGQRGKGESHMQIQNGQESRETLYLVVMIISTDIFCIVFATWSCIL